jgi:hypothetical protein
MSAKTVTYTPRSGSPRTIDAIVEYPGPESIGEFEGGSAPLLDILVANNSTEGIDSAEVDTGGDKITLPKRRDLAGRVTRITRIINQDEVLVRLRLQ